MQQVRLIGFIIILSLTHQAFGYRNNTFHSNKLFIGIEILPLTTAGMYQVYLCWRNDSTFSCISHLICVKQTKNWHIKCWKKTMYHWIPYQTKPSTYIRCIRIEFTVVFIWFVILCFPLFAVAVGFSMGSISHKNWCRFDSAYSWCLFQISWLI